MTTNNLFVREFERKNGDILKINQSLIGDVGCVVWDAALVLASYLETPDFSSNDSALISKLEGKRVVELGAGTGLVGLQAACLGAHCLLTDLPEFMPLLNMNLADNKASIAGSAEAKTLKWGTSDMDHFSVADYILIADCVYYKESLQPLVDTIVQLSNEATQILCCYEERTTGDKPELEKKYFELIQRHFHVEEIPGERQDPFFRSPDIHVMKFTKS